MSLFARSALVLLALILAPSALAREAAYLPTSFEILYQPTYTLPTGGPSSQVGPLGGGLKLGYQMIPRIGFELGGYYNGMVFGGVSGSNLTVGTARATADFQLNVLSFFNIYVGADWNVYFNPPGPLAMANVRDMGIIGGAKILLGGKTVKLIVGAEYRYALAAGLTNGGTAITVPAVLGTLGIHFGGVL